MTAQVNGDASAIGWAGNSQGVVACLGGSFWVDTSGPNDGPGSGTTAAVTGTTYGYGIYDNSTTTWANAEGCLPALVTGFHRDGAAISITNFGDDVTIGGHAYVVICSRVQVTNPTGETISIDPQPSAGLVPLNSAPVAVPPHTTVNHDYAVASDRFGGSYASASWPTCSTRGYTANAHALLDRARHVSGNQPQYVGGVWTYPWVWAVYLLKTGDMSFVKANFATEGPGGKTEPSIQDTAHMIAADRTGPGGIMEQTNDIDANGYWTIDNYEALMGLWAYHWLAQQVGSTSEANWAATQYSSLLAAVNKTLNATISANHLNYLPCSIIEPNTSNRCANAEDANWAAPFLFGRWAWDGQLFGAPLSGPGVSLIDATYRYGFARLAGKLPPDTFGGYPTQYYSTAYNAGYGEWGLASQDYRSQGISLAAQRSDGSLVVGRGVPSSWVASGQVISLANFPTTGGRHLGLTVRTSGRSVTVTLTGQQPSGPVLFQLPAFVGNIAGASAGTIDQKTGTVTLSPTVRTVTVQLAHAPAAGWRLLRPAAGG